MRDYILMRQILAEALNHKEDDSEPIMSVIDRIKEKVFVDDFDPYNGNFMLYEIGYCNFEVLDDGNWYKIDASHPWHELYEDEDVPEDIAMRLEKIAEQDENWNAWQVPVDVFVKHNEDLLRAEFDDVRFLGTDYVPGAVY